MKDSKNILFTFDYELFLGKRSGSVYECMIDPTNRLLEIFRDTGVAAIFFVDTTYLMRLQEYSTKYHECKNDFNTVAAQLKHLVRQGHYVYPHIHPHWLDAKYDAATNQWELSNISRYRFHNLSEQDRTYVFDGSVDILNSILLPEFPDYRIDGFRAGGWSLQPFTDFLPYFRKHKINYDFSVLPGTYQFSNAQCFDFTPAPRKPMYRFNDDVNNEVEDGTFTELVSSIISITPFTRFVHRMHLHWLHRVSGDHTYGKGEGQRSIEDFSRKPLMEGGFSIHDPLHQPVSIETMSTAKLPTYFKFLKEHSYMQFVSHPKMLSLHNIRTVRRFVNTVKSQYTVDFDFKSFINSGKELY